MVSVRRLLAAVTVAALGSAGCTSSNVAFDGPAPRAEKLAAPAANPQPSCDPMRLRTSKAPRLPAGIMSDERVLPNRVDAESAHFMAVNASGEALYEVGSEAGGNEENLVLKPGALVIFDPATGRTVDVRGKGTARDDVQLTEAALDRTHASWLAEPDLSDPDGVWKLYAANRATGEISTVAEEKRNGHGLPGISLPRFSGPSLLDGRVYWSENGGTSRSDVYTRKLDSSEPASVLVAKAGMPVATEDWLYYVGYDTWDRDRPGHAIYRRSLASGATTLVRNVGHRVNSLAAHGDTVAWSANGTVEVFDGSKPIAAIKAAPGELLHDLTVGDGAVGFAGLSKAGAKGAGYLLDLRTGCLHNLTNAASLSEVRIAGSVVTWATDMHGHQSWHHATLR